MQLTSSAFKNGDILDAVFTVEGTDISPPLEWSEPSAQTKSFAIICDDPDAPSAQRPGPEPWVHWILFNIPSNVNTLSSGVSRNPEPDAIPGASQGQNSWPDDNIGYRGPAPPPSSGPHRYFFKLYALDLILPLTAGATKSQLLEAMDSHILAECQLFGVYER